MEIIYKTTEEKSNFSFCSDIFKDKKVLNGFNKSRSFKRYLWYLRS